MTTDLIDKESELFDLLQRERNPEKNLELLSTHLMPGGKWLMVKHKPRHEKPGKRSAVAIAAWTTSVARVRLNRLLQEFADQLVYADTGEFCDILSK